MNDASWLEKVQCNAIAELHDLERFRWWRLPGSFSKNMQYEHNFYRDSLYVTEITNKQKEKSESTLCFISQS